VKLSGEELGPLLGTEEPGEAAQTLLDRSVALVLVSMGERGAYYVTETFQGSVPAFEVEVVDTTGAGDEERVRKAVRRGSATGAIACTGYGGMASAH
jgi:fructokinase